MKKNRGITLIALVITIIVLLILAGVAIAMLSGENGILKKAAEAKTKTEQAQKQEETRLSDLEVQIDFSKNGTPYKFSNGYLTGIIVKNKNKSESVQEVINKLPKNYNILNVDGSEIEDKTISVTTGMVIKEGSNEVGRVLIYGDFDLNGEINGNDSTYIDIFLFDKNLHMGEEEIKLEEAPHYLILSMDVDHNNIINADDSKLIDRIYFDNSDEEIEQDVQAPNYDDINIEFSE